MAVDAPVLQAIASGSCSRLPEHVNHASTAAGREVGHCAVELVHGGPTDHQVCCREATPTRPPLDSPLARRSKFVPRIVVEPAVVLLHLRSRRPEARRGPRTYPLVEITTCGSTSLPRLRESRAASLPCGLRTPVTRSGRPQSSKPGRDRKATEEVYDSHSPCASAPQKDHQSRSPVAGCAKHTSAGDRPHPRRWRNRDRLDLEQPRPRVGSRRGCGRGESGDCSGSGGATSKTGGRPCLKTESVGAPAARRQVAQAARHEHRALLAQLIPGLRRRTAVICSVRVRGQGFVPPGCLPVGRSTNPALLAVYTA